MILPGINILGRIVSSNMTGAFEDVLSSSSPELEVVDTLSLELLTDSNIVISLFVTISEVAGSSKGIIGGSSNGAPLHV